MSWQTVKIGDFLRRSKIPIEIENSKQYKRVTIRGKHKGIALRDIEAGKAIGTKKQFVLKAGQFVLSKIDARYGAFGIAPAEVDDAIITGNFWAYDVDKEKVNIEWFNQYTNSPIFYELCERASSGITHRKYLDEKFFLNHEIDLPSIDEQETVINLINTQKSWINGVATELDHQLALVKELRQAYLREAMQGKLVPQDPADEPAEILLAEIKAEKEKLIAEKRIKRDKPLPPINPEEAPFEIPSHWTWCRLGNLIELISGQHIDSSDYNEKGDGFPYLTGPSDFGEIYPNPTRWTTKPKVFAIENDILITVKGSGVGKTNLSNLEKVVISRQLMAIRTTWVSSGYIHFFLTGSYELLQSEKKGTGIPGITRENILEKPFPLPPLAEQERIAAKLEKLMRFCDELDANIKQGITNADRLLQTALREALEPKITE